MKIYLSHTLGSESKARELAKKLEYMGYEVIVAADVRPKKEFPRNKKDLEVVRRAIASCDRVVVVF